MSEGPRTRTLFIRLSDEEAKYFETAVRLMYGKVDQYRSEFARKAILDMSIRVIRAAQKKRQQMVEAED